MKKASFVLVLLVTAVALFWAPFALDGMMGQCGADPTPQLIAGRGNGGTVMNFPCSGGICGGGSPGHCFRCVFAPC